MAKKKIVEEPKPENHPFCFQEKCEHYIDHVVDNTFTIKVCNYVGHKLSLGCLCTCPKNTH